MHDRILLILFGDVGDTLLAVPALRALRQRYPVARIVLLGKETSARIAQDLALVDDAIVVDKHLFDSPASLARPPVAVRLAALLLRLRREDFDTVVIFHHLLSAWGTLKLGLLSLATLAPERIGLDHGPGWFLTRRVHDSGLGARHEAEYWMDVVGLLDAHGPLRLEAPVDDADRVSAGGILARAGIGGEPLLAIHAGTGTYGPGRRWPADRFARAASMVLDVRPMKCIVVGTEIEAAESVEVARLLGSRAVCLVGMTTLGELGAVLERCSALIANDGGVAHLAAACGTPAITVFGPSNDRAWKPLVGPAVTVDLPCRPCFYRDFDTGFRQGIPPRDCLQLVTPRMVADAVLAVLAERPVAV